VRLGISFHEDARIEFDEAADFYGMERAPLGLAFVGAVEHAVDHVSEFPESCPVQRGRVRKMRVQRFPYSVMYSIVDDAIRVLAVAHDRRRPYYWSGRD
jgi:plasmid stabilization system protein ParE